jgi:Domain of unknown function (DUF202)
VSDGSRLDPGLQVERTELAWVRTALGCGGLSVLATHLAGRGVGPGWALVVGAVVAIPGLLASGLRVRGLRTQAGRAPVPPRAVALLVTTVALADAVALGVLLR